MQKKEILVNNKKYVLKKFNAIDALKLKVRITKLVATALGGIENISKDDMSNIMSQDVASLVGKLSQAVERVDEDKFVNLVIDLLSKNITQIKHADSMEVEVPLIIDTLEIMEMYEIAIEVVKFNLGKFIDDIKLRLNSKSEALKQDN